MRQNRFTSKNTKRDGICGSLCGENQLAIFGELHRFVRRPTRAVQPRLMHNVLRHRALQVFRLEVVLRMPCGSAERVVAVEQNGVVHAHVETPATWSWNSSAGAAREWQSTDVGSPSAWQGRALRGATARRSLCSTSNLGPQTLDLGLSSPSDNGRLTRPEAKYLKFNYMGDVTWVQGRGTDKFEQDGKAFVRCTLECVNNGIKRMPVRFTPACAPRATGG